MLRKDIGNFILGRMIVELTESASVICLLLCCSVKRKGSFKSRSMIQNRREAVHFMVIHHENPKRL
jgi:hypothetical protein